MTLIEHILASLEHRKPQTKLLKVQDHVAACAVRLLIQEKNQKIFTATGDYSDADSASENALRSFANIQRQEIHP